MVKRKHTLDLKRKIDEKTKEEAEIEKSNINEVRQLEDNVIEPQKDHTNKSDQVGEIIQNDEETTSKQKITEVPKSQDGKTSQEDKLKENENSIKAVENLNIGEIIENEELEIDEIEERKNLKKSINYHPQIY